MNLSSEFDVVLMLTWSNWDTEPRSNRYHYAARFSRELPTYFFQHNYSQKDGVKVRSTEIPNLEIVEISSSMTETDIEDVKNILRMRGFKKPLIWIYDSIRYQNLIKAFPNGYFIYHATEDYFTPTNGWSHNKSRISQSVSKLLKEIDLVIYVSEGLKNVYRDLGGYSGPGYVIKNGCDAEFFLALQKNKKLTSKLRPSVIFQGGINNRLDFELLLELISNMPDWDFKFCGHATTSITWDKIIDYPNVFYYGELPPQEVGEHMIESTVGIIPFIQDDWIKNSLPLKAYEYVACGLPVVTVPINDLATNQDIFSFATSAAEFESKIRSNENVRHEISNIQMRHQAAIENSYNKRFDTFKASLLASLSKKLSITSKKVARVAVLYDPIVSLNVSTIYEHLESFHLHSKNEITYIPATSEYWINLKNSPFCLDIFDVVILHYSVRLSLKCHLDNRIYENLKTYHGLKLLFLQDEYEGVESVRTYMDDIKFDIVYTCVPNESINKIYPSYRYPGTKFCQVLTGYTSENNGVQEFAKPLRDRNIDIAYRGRELPAIYGELGREKHRIGVQIKELAIQYGLNVDIETSSEKRIYGDKWYEFLGSARATLGTESGSNIFDFDGSIQKAINSLEASHPNTPYDVIHENILSRHEGHIRMNQISPKIFESIQLKTILILFEGTYSNVVIPNIHFIPLKKDYSNIQEVFKKILDDSFVENMTSRAYSDIIESGKFSYTSFIKKIDQDIAEYLIHHVNRKKIFCSYYRLDENGDIEPILLPLPVGLLAGHYPIHPHALKKLKSPLDGVKVKNTKNLLSSYAQSLIKTILRGKDKRSFLFLLAKKLWIKLPYSIQIRLLNFMRL
jgi:hypothetical protein